MLIRTIFKLLVRPLALAVLVYYLATLAYFGLFTQWQEIGMPSKSDKVVALYKGGYVETKSGKIYQYAPDCPLCDKAKAWKQVESLPDDSQEYQFSLEQCETYSFLPFRQNEFADSIKNCEAHMMGQAMTVYAIDKNGMVYLWQNSHGGEYSGLERLILPVFFGFIMFFLGWFF